MVYENLKIKTDRQFEDRGSMIAFHCASSPDETYC